MHDPSKAIAPESVVVRWAGCAGLWEPLASSARKMKKKLKSVHQSQQAGLAGNERACAADDDGTPTRLVKGPEDSGGGSMDSCHDSCTVFGC